MNESGIKTKLLEKRYLLSNLISAGTGKGVSSRGIIPGGKEEQVWKHGFGKVDSLGSQTDCTVSDREEWKIGLKKMLGLHCDEEHTAD